MNNLIFSFILIGLLILGAVFFFYNQESSKNNETESFQGPVPEGYDEDYFRKTGITKLLEVE